jgi:hypothetical protein
METKNIISKANMIKANLSQEQRNHTSNGRKSDQENEKA